MNIPVIWISLWRFGFMPIMGFILLNFRQSLLFFFFLLSLSVFLLFCQLSSNSVQCMKLLFPQTRYSRNTCGTSKSNAQRTDGQQTLCFTGNTKMLEILENIVVQKGSKLNNLLRDLNIHVRHYNHHLIQDLFFLVPTERYFHIEQKSKIFNPYYLIAVAPVRHTLQPLCDLSATDNLHQSQRSQQGPRSVPARLQRSRRLIGGPCYDRISRSQVFVLAQKPGCDWYGHRQVPAKSPTSPRPIAD